MKKKQSAQNKTLFKTAADKFSGTNIEYDLKNAL
jgi:hypothetical protein